MRKRVFLLILCAFLGLPLGCSRQDSSPRTTADNSNQPAGPRKSPTQGNSETKTLRGLVIGIIDGDTIEVLDDQEASYRIRLKGIDAPEKRQAFGNVSRRSLALLLAGKTVTVEWQKHDRNGRIVG